MNLWLFCCVVEEEGRGEGYSPVRTTRSCSPLLQHLEGPPPRASQTARWIAVPVTTLPVQEVEGCIRVVTTTLAQYISIGRAVEKLAFVSPPLFFFQSMDVLDYVIFRPLISSTVFPSSAVGACWCEVATVLPPVMIWPKNNFTSAHLRVFHKLRNFQLLVGLGRAPTVCAQQGVSS